MIETSHDKLDELLDLVKENNRILRSMHRKQVLGQIMTFIYWMIILGLAGWSYYILQPYLIKYMNMYQNITNSLNSINEGAASLPTDLNTLLEKMQ